MQTVKRRILKLMCFPPVTLDIVAQSEYTGQYFYCTSKLGNTAVIGTWSIVSGGQYATINEYGKVDIVAGTISQYITVHCEYGTYVANKQILVSYDNQLVIECADTIEGILGNAIAMYNGEVVNATWYVVGSEDPGTIDELTGQITIFESGSIVIQANYEGYQTTKTVNLVYVEGKQQSTEVSEDGSVTTTETTATVNPDGTVTETSTGHTVHADGSTSEVESTTVIQEDGSFQNEQTITNQDGTSTESVMTGNADGSSETTTVNYDENGQATTGSSNTTDTQGNSNTQSVEYDEEGNTTVTGYTIDTSENESGGEVIVDGLDTGFVAFDGRAFTIHLVANFDPSNNRNAILLSAMQDGTTSGRYSGFGVSFYNTNSVCTYAGINSSIVNLWSLYTTFGEKISGDISTSTNQQYLRYLKSGSKSYTIDITYIPQSMSPEYMYTLTIQPLYTSTRGNTQKSLEESTFKSNSSYMPTELDNATVTIGSYGVYHDLDMSSIEVLEFEVIKIS